MTVRVLRVALSTAAALGVPVVALAQPVQLTLAEALARARQQAPRITAARLRIDEARGRLLGASVRFPNPSLEGAAGPRTQDVGRSTDIDIGLTQGLEPPGRRAARVAAATAGVDRESAAVEETVRAVVRDVARQFMLAVHIGERVRLLDNAERLATEILRISERRYAAGDVAVLDVNIVRAALARVRADRQAAEAADVAALGELKQLLGLTGDVSVAGILATEGPGDLPTLLARAAERPEIRAIEAEVREAEADVRLGRSFARPDVALGVRYEREEGDRSVLGGLTVTLPVFARGQELRAVGAARAERLRVELDAMRRAIETEVRTRAEVYERRRQAVAVLERDALPGLDENERLVTRSFDVGQLGLPELLLVRREILDTRLQYLDALLEVAVARIERDASAGVLR